MSSQAESSLQDIQFAVLEEVYPRLNTTYGSMVGGLSEVIDSQVRIGRSRGTQGNPNPNEKSLETLTEIINETKQHVR